MNPIPISKELRVMLQKHGLCSTPQDELMKRFKFAKVEEIPATSFATHMSWMLTALLKASPATESMKLIFVDGMHLEVNVGLFQHEWRVHDNWLTWQGTTRTPSATQLQPTSQRPSRVTMPSLKYGT